MPKYRRKALYRDLRKNLREIFHELARQRECRIIEGHLLRDLVHMLIEIPPKERVSEVVGYIKGKSAIAIARIYAGKKRNFCGENFWACGYFVTTVGLDEAVVQEYIRNQEKEDVCLDQFNLQY
jgi:putative transposase